LQDQIAVSNFSNFEYRMAELEEEVRVSRHPSFGFPNTHHSGGSRSSKKGFPDTHQLGVWRSRLERTPLSDLCDQRSIHPTMFYRWQNESANPAMQRTPAAAALSLL